MAAKPMVIRSQVHPLGLRVRVLMPHANEGGRRKDDSGALIEAWFIERLELHHNDRQVLRVELGSTVSQNPFLECILRDARVGDRLLVQWWDSRGESRQDSVVLGA